MTTSLMSNRKEDPEKMMPRVVVYIGPTLNKFSWKRAAFLTC